MGCGILFPEDYNDDYDSESVGGGKCNGEGSPHGDGVGGLGDDIDEMLDPLNELDSSDSDDEGWGNNQPNNHGAANNQPGTKVKVSYQCHTGVKLVTGSRYASLLTRNYFTNHTMKFNDIDSCCIIAFINYFR